MELLRLPELPSDKLNQPLFNEGRVLTKLSNLKGLLNRHADNIETTRGALAAILHGKVRMHPVRRSGKRYYAAELWGNMLGVMELVAPFSLVGYSATGNRTPV